MKLQYNKNFDRLSENYLFSEVRRRVSDFLSENPSAKVIDLGVGDVIGGLCPSTVETMRKAVEEYAYRETFKGYPKDRGYLFLRQKIADYYSLFGANICADDLYISDGAKSDLGNILDIFEPCTALIPTPVYPVYVDTNVIKGNEVRYILATPQNNFLPMPDGLPKQPFLIYICSPNNPTGATYSYEELSEWVKYAIYSDSLIIFDSAYEAFVRGDKPRSIFQIKDSDKCSIEIGSFSKRAGFTGLRLGYTIIKKGNARMEKIAKIWLRRQTAKFNGVSYLIQKAGESTLTTEGIAECNQKIEYYLSNARQLKTIFQKMGYSVYGGEDSPYVWIDCREDSWTFFEKMLAKYHIVGTAGDGFGEGGRGYFRLSSFTTAETIAELKNRVLR